MGFTPLDDNIGPRLLAGSKDVFSLGQVANCTAAVGLQLVGHHPLMRRRAAVTVLFTGGGEIRSLVIVVDENFARFLRSCW